MANTDRYYFAFGSNMDIDQMAQRCPGAKFNKKGLLLCYRFAIDEARVATIIPDNRGCVEGILWKVGANDLEQLDLYEGVANGCYRRATVDIMRSQYDTVEAIVYISNRPERKIADGTGSPYMKRIAEVAYAYEFPTSYQRLLNLYAHAWSYGSKV